MHEKKVVETFKLRLGCRMECVYVWGWGRLSNIRSRAGLDLRARLRIISASGRLTFGFMVHPVGHFTGIPSGHFPQSHLLRKKTSWTSFSFQDLFGHNILTSLAFMTAGSSLRCPFMTLVLEFRTGCLQNTLRQMRI